MYKNLKILIIDVGHGGSDPGAVGNGVVEKVANLNTALALKAAAEAMGIKVFITRTTDVTMSLEARVKFANDIARQYPGATILFVSIHHNAGGGDRAEAIHSIYRGEGQRAANLIANELHSHLGQQKKVYEKRGSDNKDYYYVIRNTSMDAVIVEVAFLDNINDVQICDSVEEQQRNGQVIACAIGKFFGVISSCNDNGGTQPSQPDPAPVPPQKRKLDVFYKVWTAEDGWLPEVKNITDYAGVFGHAIRGLMIRLSSGDVDYKVSTLRSNSYYPIVRNHSDYAGDLKNNIDKVQILNNKLKYRVRLLNGRWLPWVIGNSDFAGLEGYSIDAIEIDSI